MNPFFAQADPLAQAATSLSQAATSGGAVAVLSIACTVLGAVVYRLYCQITLLQAQLITEIKAMAKDSADVVKETREVFATIKDRLDRIGGPRP